MVDWILENFLKAFNGTQNDRQQDTSFAIGLTISCILLNGISLLVAVNHFRGGESRLGAVASSPWLAIVIAGVAIWYSFVLVGRAASKWRQIDADLFGKGRATLTSILYVSFSIMLFVGMCFLR